MEFGGSLTVPSVQELAKENLEAVPPRYQRPQEQDFVISQVDDEFSTIPVIDLNNLLSQQSGDAELQKLHLACKEWGFFQLVNHGIETTFLEKVKLEIKEFFNLPMSEKNRFRQKSGDIEGFGQLFVVSEDQKLDWSDIFIMITRPIHKRKPHLFPYLPLPLRDTLELYSQQVKNVGMTIIEHIAKVLKCKEIVELFEDDMQMFRMNYYPPCPTPENVIGLTPHSDGAGLTLLLQLTEVEGLQIKKDAKWVPIKPLPNSFIVNIGDMLEIITNGIYGSIEHRATVNCSEERITFATFIFPKYDGKLGPASTLVTEETPLQFKTTTVEEHLKSFLGRELDGKSYIASKKI
ncbi:hypothetical protein Lal_00032496 [Lupinus albus]|uniref:Putative codeine 3-O-demethylase n=1 Tax=Lupinus albus TaxID=3870 RepID=A0A6A4R907_LUPAL|nr:putative codeine 3-O-demethylase [Lupinus albus]KAF1897738.1 hypothetical protein Lal_00032496 [Lupinus albus]